MIRSALRYRYDPEYRANVEREVEQIFAYLCACNDPLVHRQAQARLELVQISAEPLYQSAFEDVQQKLIAKYYDDTGKLRYPFVDNLLGKSAEPFCKSIFVPQELPARFAALSDRSALMQESNFLRNVWTKMMSIGWRCQERGNHPRSSCTLEQAREHWYNRNLLKIITSCQQGDYHESYAHLDPSDQLMCIAYCSVLAERLMDDHPEHKRRVYEALDLYPGYDLHAHAQASADLVTTSPSFTNQDFLVLDYDLEAQREQTVQKYRYEQAVHEHTVTINRQAEELVHYYGHDVAPFKHINGNALQHQLLDETAYLICAAADYADIKETELPRLVVDMAALATDYNHVGSVDKGYACATVGWHVLDTLRLITVGIAQGVVIGATSAAQYIVEHPIEFAAAVFMGKAFLAYQIAQVMIHYGPDVIDYFSSIDYSNLTHDDVIKGFNTIENLCRNEYEALKHKPLNDFIAGGTALIVDAFIQKKCAKALHSFSQTAQQRLTRALVSSPASRPLQVPPALATSSAGHGRKSSSQKNTHSRSSHHEQPVPRKLAPKIYTMKDFFQSTTLGQSLKEKSVKTNHFFKGQPIYRLRKK